MKVVVGVESFSLSVLNVQGGSGVSGVFLRLC